MCLLRRSKNWGGPPPCFPLTPTCNQLPLYTNPLASSYYSYDPYANYEVNDPDAYIESCGVLLMNENSGGSCKPMLGRVRVSTIWPLRAIRGIENRPACESSVNTNTAVGMAGAVMMLLALCLSLSCTWVRCCVFGARNGCKESDSIKDESGPSLGTIQLGLARALRTTTNNNNNNNNNNNAGGGGGGGIFSMLKAKRGELANKILQAKAKRDSARSGSVSSNAEELRGAEQVMQDTQHLLGFMSSIQPDGSVEVRVNHNDSPSYSTAGPSPSAPAVDPMLSAASMVPPPSHMSSYTNPLDLRPPPQYSMGMGMGPTMGYSTPPTQPQPYPSAYTSTPTTFSTVTPAPSAPQLFSPDL